MSSVVVLGFFANRDEARSAAVELNRRRLPRAALLLKDSDGALETWDPFSRRRLGGASLSIVIWGGLLGLARSVFGWRFPFLPLFLSVPAISLAASMAALVVARVWFRRQRFGVERRGGAAPPPPPPPGPAPAPPPPGPEPHPPRRAADPPPAPRPPRSIELLRRLDAARSWIN